MSRRPKRTTSRKGIPPGSAVYRGPPREHTVTETALRYDPERFDEVPEPAAGRVLWIDLDGVHEASRVEELCRRFRLHPLAMESILSPASRPRLDQFGELLVATVRMLPPDGKPEQISVVLGPGVVLTFQERPGDVFEPVRRRIREALGRIRGRGADYLFHALLDAIVDDWIERVHGIDDQVEQLEGAALGEATPELLADVQRLRADLMTIRRAAWPLRDALVRLQTADSELIAPETRPFMRDLLDHVAHVQDASDGLRERLVSVLELSLAVTSNRMNEVMRLLTLVASVFIPLTFVAGIYGMNFQNMPELAWKYGYPAALGLMLVLGIGMGLWYRSRRWL